MKNYYSLGKQNKQKNISSEEKKAIEVVSNGIFEVLGIYYRVWNREKDQVYYSETYPRKSEINESSYVQYITNEGNIVFIFLYVFSETIWKN